jgi:hypothetical protein
MKSRLFRRAGHVARMESQEMHNFGGDPMERRREKVNITNDLRDGRWMALAQDHVQCYFGISGLWYLHTSGVKRGRGVTLTTHPHLVPRLSMSRSYTSSPPMPLHGM